MRNKNQMFLSKETLLIKKYPANHEYFNIFLVKKLVFSIDLSRRV